MTAQSLQRTVVVHGLSWSVHARVIGQQNVIHLKIFDMFLLSFSHTLKKDCLPLPMAKVTLSLTLFMSTIWFKPTFWQERL